MLDGAKFLSADQFLLTTLIVKLAVMAVLATMLARYRRFRHILIFERRGWLDRLVFTLALGIPLMAGVTARLLLNYKAADLTLEGAFLAGLIAGPYAGALVGVLVGMPASIAGEFIALPFAVGCGFAGGGLREACPKEAIWQFTPFVFIDLHKHVWLMVRQAGFQLAAVAAARAGRARAAPPGARRALRREPAVLSRRGSRHAVAADDAAHHPRDRAGRRHADQDLEQRAHRAPRCRSRRSSCSPRRSRRSRARSIRISSSTRSRRSRR